MSQSASKSTSPSLETLVSLAKRRGFVFQASEIYGGLSGFYDFGPYGTALANNLKEAWLKYFVQSRPNVYGLDSAIIQHPKLWEASGHVAGFSDPLVECNNCHSRLREDKLENKDKCPVCGQQGSFSKPRQFNLMLSTQVGPAEDSSALTYLRPETAGGIYTNYENVRESMRAKLPFGIGQVGKAFRNEISPRDWLFRKRELEQMELQYFVAPKTEKPEYETLRKATWRFLTDTIGLDEKKLRWHEHSHDERAHYAAAAYDIEYKFPIGYDELVGVHDRTDFDLKSHQEASGKDLSYFDQASGDKFIPYVMESSMGLDRLFMAVLSDSYHEEEVKGEQRVVLRFKPELAPVQVAVLPLSKDAKLSPLAMKVYEDLKDHFATEYDETQSIGKRYRRQDEIGTPYCVTIDFDSLEDKKATIRERDTMKQQRFKVTDLAEVLSGKLES